MKRWLGPSLLRRSVFTLLAALVLVWVVLSLKDYWVFKQDVRNRESLGRVTQAILDSLQGFDEAQARSALQGADRVYNDLRRQAEPGASGALLFRLSRLDGTRVYVSERARDLPDLPAQGSPGRVTHQGMEHWPVVRQNAHWRLAIWVPVLEDGAALARIGLDVLGYVLLALPLVLLPLALAVWLGLRPLHSLSHRIGQRRPDDLSPLRDPTGYAELTPLVDAFNALLGRARSQREAEQTFVQDVAHELKTPLAVVAAQAHVLAFASDDAQRTAALRLLERGVQRASHQVTQLLTLAALEHDAPVARARVDVVAEVRDVLIALEPLAGERHQELVLLSPDSLMSETDGEALRLVLHNLIRNAIQHGRAGGQIEVALALEGPWVALRVTDDGPGIPAEDRERLFERFRRGDSAAPGGSGLGLAIVRRAAQRMGGSARSVDAPPGKGACFEVRWPVQETGSRAGRAR